MSSPPSAGPSSPRLPAALTKSSVAPSAVGGPHAAAPASAGAAHVGAARGAASSSSSSSSSRKTKHRKINKLHPEFELTYDMMLGIRTVVSKTEAQPHSALSAADYSDVIKLQFPGRGSILTPAHRMRDFKFKDYSPIVYKKIREAFGINPADYLLCVCGQFQFLEFVSNSKSGQFFFYTHDRQFMIKTVSKQECKFLQLILPAYYQHIVSNPDTLLTRFFGMHRVKPHKKRQRHFLIMSSVFYTDKFIHTVFDLKGSTQGRQATANEIRSGNPVYKDLDFLQQKVQMRLSAFKARQLEEQIGRDVDFLRRLSIMDYSLLLGIHYKDRPVPGELRVRAGGGEMEMTRSGQTHSVAEKEERRDELYSAHGGAAVGQVSSTARGEGAKGGETEEGSGAGEWTRRYFGSALTLPQQPTVSGRGSTEQLPQQATRAPAVSGSSSSSDTLHSPAVSAPFASSPSLTPEDSPPSAAINWHVEPDEMPAAEAESESEAEIADAAPLTLQLQDLHLRLHSDGETREAADEQPGSSGAVAVTVSVIVASPSLTAPAPLPPPHSSPARVASASLPQLLSAPGTPVNGQLPLLSSGSPSSAQTASQDFPKRQSTYGLPKRWDKTTKPSDIAFEAPEFDPLPATPALTAALDSPKRRTDKPTTATDVAQTPAAPSASATAAAAADGSSTGDSALPAASVSGSPAPSAALLSAVSEEELPFLSSHGGIGSTDAVSGSVVGGVGREIYFMGIIDILTTYNVAKFLENRVKRARLQRGISAVSPRKYAERFRAFIAAAITVVPVSKQRSSLTVTNTNGRQ